MLHHKTPLRARSGVLWFVSVGDAQFRVMLSLKKLQLEPKDSGSSTATSSAKPPSPEAMRL